VALTNKKILMKRITILILTCLLAYSGYVNGQGCAAPSSDEGVQVWGYIQPEFGAYFEDETRAAFQFRRMRVGVMGNIPYDFSYYVLLETSQFLNPNQTGPFLLEGFINYHRFGAFQQSLGAFKIPLSRELAMPCFGLYTIRRSKVVDELTANWVGGNRDLGFMLLGGSDTTLFTYQLAITNGTGVQYMDNNLLNTYMLNGRMTVKPVKGLSLGVSGRYGSREPEDESVTENDTQYRWGVDAQYSIGGFTILGEYLNGNNEGSYLEGGGCDGIPVLKTGTKEANGGYLMAIYRFNNNLEPVYKIESYKTKTGEISDTPGNLTEETSVCQTFGLNYYPNDWTRIQVNYIYAAETPREINNDAVLIQLQVRF
jgi:hypothetical protein